MTFTRPRLGPVLNADVLDAVLGTTDPEQQSKEIEIRVAERSADTCTTRDFAPLASVWKS